MGTHYKGTKKMTAALDAYIKLMRASESVAARVTRKLDDHGLTVSQFGVLEALLHLGPLSQKELARKILKSHGNVTMVLGNLEKEGLVKRFRDAEDHRFYRIELTSKGRALITDIFPEHAETIAREMAILTPAEQKQLGYLCRKLGLREK